MCPKIFTCQWRTACELAALCVAVFFLKFAAASQTETPVDTNTNALGESCDGTKAAEQSNGTLSACELKKRLRTLSQSDLEGLVAYCKGEEIEIRKATPQGNKEALKWQLVIYGITKAAMKSFISQVLTFVLKKQEEHACYETVGCFYPQNKMALEIGCPVKLERSEVNFYFYTNDSRPGKEVNHANWRDVTKRTENTKRRMTVLIHGFKESSETRQVVSLKEAVLQNVETDVIVADWRKEAAFPYYGAAAANSPLVGAQLSVLLQSMYNQVSLDPENVHLIGFSLGAHAAGFCARHFNHGTGEKIGRISGLDPAGLLFENTNVSLSSADANYVDVIHTNGGNITDLRFGTISPLGHADFYPNGGSFQPGCTGDSYTITCSHNQAWWFYIKSVQNQICKFKSIRCEDWYHCKQCERNKSSLSAVMGYYSDIDKANGIFYLETNSKSPYCIPHIAEETDKISESDNDQAPTRPPR